MEKTKIGIIGKGNVGTHLFKALKEFIPCEIVDSRKIKDLDSEYDIAIICVKDDIIEEIATLLKGKAKMIVHTSGSVPMSALSGAAEAIGVFYPLQTFTKDIPLNYKEIPFFIEGNSQKTISVLKELAGEISNKVLEADSEKRKSLHLASVFACNFSNALVMMADEILQNEELDYKILLPLMKQTIKKLNQTDPLKAQTGPASRKDFSTISRHKEMLINNPEMQEIYQKFSNYIIEKTDYNNEFDKL